VFDAMTVVMVWLRGFVLCGGLVAGYRYTSRAAATGSTKSASRSLELLAACGLGLGHWAWLANLCPMS
jgi:hypothetical protein